MSTKYFILTKDSHVAVGDDEKNQVMTTNNQTVFILPQVNISYYIDHGLFEKNLIDWSKQFCSKNKNFIDAGAHTGTYTLCLANYCQQVYAFEPQKMTYYALCGGVALSNKQNITCFNIGLGSADQSGQTTLNIVSNDGGGSTVQSCDNVLRKETITIQTLDSFNLDNIGFIKIDVEDNEYFLLLGAQKTLEKSGYPKIMYESNKKNEQLDSFLNELGYKIIAINGCHNMYLACHDPSK